ncbi:hypothetical protein OH492_23595 [Vibrio chagasii]|nr:hypothetical protein [Vibrio chagasii]
MDSEGDSFRAIASKVAELFHRKSRASGFSTRQIAADVWQRTPECLTTGQTGHQLAAQSASG